MKISEAIVRSTKNRKVAETLENTGEIIVILKGAACHSEMTFVCQMTAQARPSRQQRSFFI